MSGRGDHLPPPLPQSSRTFWKCPGPRGAVSSCSPQSLVHCALWGERRSLFLEEPWAEGSLPVKCVLAFSPEIVHVRPELQLEHEVLVDALGLGGKGEGVAEQRQAGQGLIVLAESTEGGFGAVAGWGGGG